MTVGENLKYMIFDEVDSLLEQGFLKAVKEIVDYFPQPYVDGQGLSRKLGMFSATESPRIESLVRYIFGTGVKIFDREVDPDFIKHNALQ